MEETTKNINKIKKINKVNKVDVYAETICEDTVDADTEELNKKLNEQINMELGLEDEDETIISEEERDMVLKQKLTVAGLIHFFGNKIQSFSRDNEGNISIKFNNFNKKNK